MRKVSVILPAAGLGTRMGRGGADKSGASRKQFMLLDGAPIFLYTVRKFAACDSVTEIILAVRKEDQAAVREVLERAALGKPVRVVEGGGTRQESVENALAVVDPRVVRDAVLSDSHERAGDEVGRALHSARASQVAACRRAPARRTRVCAADARPL